MDTGTDLFHPSRRAQERALQDEATVWSPHRGQFAFRGELRCSRSTARHKEIIMRDRFSSSTVTAAIAAATVAAAISAPVMSVTPASPQVALKPPWGAPDLQGICTDEFDPPLQRP